MARIALIILWSSFFIKYFQLRIEIEGADGVRNVRWRGRRIWGANWKELSFKECQNRMCLCVLRGGECRAKLRDDNEAKERERSSQRGGKF